MDDLVGPGLFLALAGFVGGLLLFVRGLIAYRHDRLVSSVATSSIDAIAAGEVRVSGVVEIIDQALVSPLQSKPCVWYRSRIEETGENARVLFDEERSKEFRIRDASGLIRVIPGGARWEVGTSFDESTSLTGAEPPGLRRRTGGAYTSVLERDPDEMTELEREAAVQALLTIQRLTPSAFPEDAAGGFWSGGIGRGGWPGSTSLGVMRPRKRYREARLEPGETVTVVGEALPWADVRDSILTWEPGSNVAVAMAADIARAREVGLLAASPEEAWGNAAIPGFGIGRPASAPRLDPEVSRTEPVPAEAQEAAVDHHTIADEELVLSRGEHGVLAIYRGAPQMATGHHDFAFVLGVFGAVLAVASVLTLGAILAATL